MEAGHWCPSRRLGGYMAPASASAGTRLAEGETQEEADVIVKMQVDVHRCRLSGNNVDNGDDRDDNSGNKSDASGWHGRYSNRANNTANAANTAFGTSRPSLDRPSCRGLTWPRRGGMAMPPKMTQQQSNADTSSGSWSAYAGVQDVDPGSGPGIDLEMESAMGCVTEAPAAVAPSPPFFPSQAPPYPSSPASAPDSALLKVALTLSPHSPAVKRKASQSLFRCPFHTSFCSCSSSFSSPFFSSSYLDSATTSLLPPSADLDSPPASPPTLPRPCPALTTSFLDPASPSSNTTSWIDFGGVHQSPSTQRPDKQHHRRLLPLSSDRPSSSSSSTANMPSSTLPAYPMAAASALSPSSTDGAALLRDSLESGLDLADNQNPWPRPASTRSHHSAPSTGPLLGRLARRARHHRQHEHAHSQPHLDLYPRPHPALDNGHRIKGTKNYSTKASSHSRRFSHSSGGPPPLTREEFEALPVAIQRKYFSTLERLRFAQGSGMVDGIYQHYNAITAQNYKRRRQGRSASEHITGRLKHRPSRDSVSLASTSDTIFFANLPDKIKKRQFTREEQVYLAGQLRASVILDAADEAIYKIGRRASTRRETPPYFDVENSSVLSDRPAMETAVQTSGTRQRMRIAPLDLAAKRNSGMTDSMYDAFRWLEEEDDLDLRLFLDDYHANLRESLPSPKQRQPSFRRHLSITKIPFGRTSVSSSRPTTKETGSTPNSPGLPGTTPFPMLPATSHGPSPVAMSQTHTRRKSRTLSLITPRHVANESISMIDPSAAHYQDPEARLKLRVYLASPQKFDEAIEFGFPSSEVLSAASTTVGAGTPTITTTAASTKKWSGITQDNGPASPDHLRTFLADDDEDEDKLDSDRGSIPDPESPKTPNLIETAAQGGKPAPYRPYRISNEPISGHRSTDSYAQAPASSREMTLRMTLTRPDLRACQDQIYGWQSQQAAQPWVGRKSQSPLREDLLGSSPVSYIGNGGSRPKESIEQVFAGIDHWGAEANEKGRMKRFWDRVRRS